MLITFCLPRHLFNVEDFDAIIFDERSFNVEDLPAKRRSEQFYIFTTFEAPTTWNWRLGIKKAPAQYFNWTWTYRWVCFDHSIEIMHFNNKNAFIFIALITLKDRILHFQCLMGNLLRRKHLHLR